MKNMVLNATTENVEQVAHKAGELHRHSFNFRQPVLDAYWQHLVCLYPESKEAITDSWLRGWDSAHKLYQYPITTEKAPAATRA